MDIDDKATGSIYSASEFNEFKNESQNAIESAGVILSSSSEVQLAKALTIASLSAQIYVDSGVADAYSLTTNGAFEQPDAYIDGMTVAFITANANTAASTVNLSGLGVVPIVAPDESALIGNEIIENYSTVMTYKSSIASFVLNPWNTGIVARNIDSIAKLRLIGGDYNKQEVSVLGYYGAGKGGGQFYWDASSTDTDNNGTIIKVTAVVTGRWIRLDQTIITPYMFGAKGDNSADDTIPLDNAYEYAGSATALYDRIALYLQGGKYKTTAALEPWDRGIRVYGDGIEFSIIAKSGNYDTVTVTYGEGDIRDFGISTTTGAIIVGDTGDGLVIGNATGGFNLAKMSGISVQYQGGDGILQGHATGSSFRNILSRLNGGSGLILDSVGGALNNNANTYNNLDLLGNGDHGLWIKNGDNDYNIGTGIVSQQNGKNGVFCEALNNNLTVYCEVNDQDGGGIGTGTYKDVNLSSQSTRNQINLTFATTDASYYNVGTDNVLYNIGTSGSINIGQIGQRKKDENVVGESFSLFAGAAGDGAAPRSGGTLFIQGGEAAGTGDAPGGGVFIEGGAPLGVVEQPGAVFVQTSGEGSFVVGSVTATSTHLSLDLAGTDKGLGINILDAAAVASLPLSRPMIFYNSTTTDFQAILGGILVNISTTAA